MPSFIYVGMILMVVAGGGAVYYKNTQATIMELTSYNATLTAQVDQIQAVSEINHLLNKKQNRETGITRATDRLAK